MKRKKGNTCELCRKRCTDFEPINEITKEILEVLRLKPSPVQDEEPIICRTCSKVVQKFFEFKSKCLYTEDCIVPFLKPGNDNALNMKTVYKETVNRDGKTIVRIPNSHGICRLCMELVKGGRYVSLVDSKGGISLERNILQKYFPEITLKSIMDPVICALCQDSLQKYYDFIIGNLRANINNRQSIVILKKIKYEPEDAQIEQESNVASRTVEDGSKRFQDDATENGRENAPKKVLHECSMCLYESHNVYSFRKHQRVHQDDVEGQLKCDMCPYETSVRDDFKTHIATHKDGKIFKCDKCPFKVNHKGRYTRHLVVHSYPRDSSLLKCVKCLYVTNRKDSLRDHMNTHKNPSERTYYECPVCSKTVTYKRKLQRHILTHKVASGGDVPMHKCPHCSYQTIRHDSLKRHTMRHEKDADVTFYECQLCPHKTNIKSSLKTHMLKHKKSSELEMYQCDECDYKTKYKGGVKKHKITHHKGLEDAPTFRCYNCSFETKVKGSLEKHMNVHAGSSDVPMHKCKMCSFDTRYLTSMKRHVIDKHYNALYA